MFIPHAIGEIQVGTELEMEKYLVNLDQQRDASSNPNQIISTPPPTPSPAAKTYVPPTKSLGTGLKKRRQPSLEERLQNQEEHLRKVRKDQGKSHSFTYTNSTTRNGRTAAANSSSTRPFKIYSS